MFLMAVNALINCCLFEVAEFLMEQGNYFSLQVCRNWSMKICVCVKIYSPVIMKKYARIIIVLCELGTIRRLTDLTISFGQDMFLLYSSS